MNDLNDHQKMALGGTIFYSVAFLVAVLLVFLWTSIAGRVVTSIMFFWAIGGLTFNIRTLRQGYRDPEEY
jgi:hypothetical protein